MYTHYTDTIIVNISVVWVTFVALKKIEKEIPLYCTCTCTCTCIK